MRIHARSVFSCVASRNKRGHTASFSGPAYRRWSPRLPIAWVDTANFRVPSGIPGLPRQQRGSIVEHRQWRVLLFAVGERQQWGVFEFRGGESLSQQRISPCLRFSVALPLGINGAERHAVGNGPELPHVAELCADGRPGGTATLDARAACCGPPGGRRPARATLKGRKSSASSRKVRRQR